MESAERGEYVQAGVCGSKGRGEIIKTTGEVEEDSRRKMERWPLQEVFR